MICDIYVYYSSAYVLVVIQYDNCQPGCNTNDNNVTCWSIYTRKCASALHTMYTLSPIGGLCVCRIEYCREVNERYLNITYIMIHDHRKCWTILYRAKYIYIFKYIL